MNNLSLEELDKLAYNFKNTDKMKMLSLHFEEATGEEVEEIEKVVEGEEI